MILRRKDLVSGKLNSRCIENGKGERVAGNETAAWAQALISGVAILASASIAVFVPWNERRVARRREDRNRLDVEARSSPDGGLELLIAYRPEFHHGALSASISLIEPSDARLYRGVTQWPENSSRRPVGKKGSLATNVRYHSVPLVSPLGIDPGNKYVGFMFVEYPDERRGPGRAKIEVRVLMHGNWMIARHTVSASAMDVEFYPQGAPPIVIDIRGRPDKAL